MPLCTIAACRFYTLVHDQFDMIHRMPALELRSLLGQFHCYP
eukprot:gene10442-biopygen8037